MQPGSHNPSEHVTGKFTRKLFLIFFSIALLPVGVILAVIYGNSSWLLRQLTLFDQQRGVVLLIGTVLILAGLVALAARHLTYPINQLVRTESLSGEGVRDQRSIIHSNDEADELSRLIDEMADERNSSHLQRTSIDTQEDIPYSQGTTQIAQIISSCSSLDELLRSCLQQLIQQFSYNYALIYLLDRKEVASNTFAILARSAGVLGLDEDHELCQRLKADRINLDTTPTMDWLVGRAIASRQPQVGSTPGEISIYEAAIPIVQNIPGHEGRVLGVLDLFVINRANDPRLSPFSRRAISEIQTIVGIMALGLANLMSYPVPTGLVATGKLSSFMPDLETVLSTSRQIAEAEDVEQILKAIIQALQTSPFVSAVLLRPDDTTMESSEAKASMRLIECRKSVRNQPSSYSKTPGTPLNPSLDAVEKYFFNRQYEFALISDVNQTHKNLDQQSHQTSNPVYPFSFDEPEPPRDLVTIARALGCRSAAIFPAVSNEKLLAILLIGSTADMPPLTGNQELLGPYQDLLSLAATGLERVQAKQNIQRQMVELETFRQVSQAISFETDINALYELIYRQLEMAMGTISSFGVVLYDADVNQVSVPYMIEEGKRLQISPFQLGKGFSSEIIRTRKPLLMFTQHEIDLKTQELEAMQVGDPPKSWLGVPMLYSGQVIGLIIVQDVKDEYRFSSQDERLLGMLANQIAVVVRNARLLEATRRQARQERLVNEISDRIRRQVDVQAILKTTTDEICHAVGARRATMRIDPQPMGKDNSELTPVVETQDASIGEAS